MQPGKIKRQCSGICRYDPACSEVGRSQRTQVVKSVGRQPLSEIWATYTWTRKKQEGPTSSLKLWVLQKWNMYKNFKTRKFKTLVRRGMEWWSSQMFLILMCYNNVCVCILINQASNGNSLVLERKPAPNAPLEISEENVQLLPGRQKVENPEAKWIAGIAAPEKGKKPEPMHTSNGKTEPDR